MLLCSPARSWLSSRHCPVVDVGQQVRLEPHILHPEEALSQFLNGLSGAGAIVSFVGVARPTNRRGEQIDCLFLDHYPGMTEQSLKRIAKDAANRFSISNLLVVHRCGLVRPGEAIVFVAAASSHRRTAFLAADYLMDRLKTDAAFWKREDQVSGSNWIEPTDQDHADRARWEEMHVGN